MKLQGIIGKGSGKLGSSVFAVSGGEQIARIYTDKVSNPNTAAQVAQRSKLKLASQLAAAMAPVIAIPKQGLKSSRNLYMKKNMPFMTATEAGASIEYEKIQLTTGNVALPAIVAEADGTTAINAALAESAVGIASRVCYVAFQKNSEEQLMLIGSTVVESAGNDGTFPGTLPYAAGEVVIYAYGMRDNNTGASARYGNYTVANGEDLAQLITNRALSAGDYSFTATVGTTIGGSGMPNITHYQIDNGEPVPYSQGSPISVDDAAAIITLIGTTGEGNWKYRADGELYNGVVNEGKTQVTFNPYGDETTWTDGSQLIYNNSPFCEVVLDI